MSTHALCVQLLLHDQVPDSTVRYQPPEGRGVNRRSQQPSATQGPWLCAQHSAGRGPVSFSPRRWKPGGRRCGQGW